MLKAFTGESLGTGYMYKWEKQKCCIRCGKDSD